MPLQLHVLRAWPSSIFGASAGRRRGASSRVLLAPEEEVVEPGVRIRPVPDGRQADLFRLPWREAQRPGGEPRFPVRATERAQLVPDALQAQPDRPPIAVAPPDVSKATRH